MVMLSSLPLSLPSILPSTCPNLRCPLFPSATSSAAFAATSVVFAPPGLPSSGRSISIARLKNHAAASAVSDLLRFAVGDDFPIDYADYFPKTDPNDRRRAGILLHPTSLPGPHGIGDLGEQAFRFLDWLHNSGCSVWQVLPLVPPGRKAGEDGSPYAGQDANCGNTLLISLEELVKDSLLTKEELPEPMDADRVEFTTVAGIKDPLVAKAAERLTKSEGELRQQLEDFRRDPTISSEIL
ncbi:4-alpha-glucanotransferase dpe1, chloroplastic/amyloplastic [Dionaea muscipula]